VNMIDREDRHGLAGAMIMLFRGLVKKISHVCMKIFLTLKLVGAITLFAKGCCAAAKSVFGRAARVGTHVNPI
jgi:hypothetical protein